MPVTVGVFVTPGDAAGRDNRSFEYDAMTDDYVRFLATSCFLISRRSTS